jgi:hypothetical protein
MKRPRRLLIDTVPWISATALRRVGRMWPGSSFRWAWARGEQRAAGCGVVTDHAVEIDGHVLPLHRHKPHFGGVRFYFGCPNCLKRCAILYLRDGAFRCRSCARLAYASTRQNPRLRAAERVRKLRARLDGSGPLDPLPSRPNGMRWRTYVRLVHRLEAAQSEHRRLVQERFSPILRHLQCRVMRFSPPRGHPPSKKKAV